MTDAADGGLLSSEGATRLHLIDGLRFAGVTPTGHTVPLDSNVDGAASAPTPMELQLVTLGGCTAMDALSILRKMREDVSGYDVSLSAERATEHPRVFTAITIMHEIRGTAVSEANVHRAIELTMTRYCPVFAMLHPTVAIRERYQITDDETGAVASGEVIPSQPA